MVKLSVAERAELIQQLNTIKEYQRIIMRHDKSDYVYEQCTKVLAACDEMAIKLRGLK